MTRPQSSLHLPRTNNIITTGEFQSGKNIRCAVHYIVEKGPLFMIRIVFYENRTPNDEQKSSPPRVSNMLGYLSLDIIYSSKLDHSFPLGKQ